MDGEKGKFKPLILLRLSATLMGHDLLGKMDAVITTDHLAFYDDQTELSGRSLTHLDLPTKVEATDPTVPVH